MSSGERSGDDAGGGAPTPSDADLLRAHVDGDPAAFAELVRRHRDRLWAVALRTIGDREEAADAIQDALLSAHRAAGRFRGDSAVTTWLHRIVVNACLDRMRRRQAHPTVPLPDGSHSDDGASHGPEPAAPMQDHDTALVVREALAGLPAEQRAAIVLVDVQGYAVAEAAEILGVAEGTIKSRCARGRARMALTLGHLRPDRPGARADTKPVSSAGSRATAPAGAQPGSPASSGTAPGTNGQPTSPTGSGTAPGTNSQPTSPTGSGTAPGTDGRPTATAGSGTTPGTDIGPAGSSASERTSQEPAQRDLEAAGYDHEAAGRDVAAGETVDAGSEPGAGGPRDAGHGNPGPSGRVPLGSAAPSEGRERP